MKIGELIKRLDETGVAVGTKLNNMIRSQIASDLLAQVKLRIQSTGMNANGGRFTGYSVRPLFLSFSQYPLNKKVFDRYKKNANANWVKSKTGQTLLVIPNGYKQARTIAGYQTAFKDFTITGSMIRGVKVKRAVLENGIIEIVYGSTDARTETLLRKHSFREKINIIAPNKQELKNIENIIGKYIENEIKRQLNG